MNKVVSFSNQKGGVGKTTSCVNMSAYLAHFGKKVLIIDMDPQGNATTGLGIKKEDCKHSVYSMLIDEVDINECLHKTQIKNLKIIPSTIDLVGAEVELVYIQNREKVLLNLLKELKEDFDYICIDCPPSLGLLTINALAASGDVIIPIQSEYYALEGLSQLMNTIKLVKQSGLNASLNIAGVLITMYDGRAIVSREISAEINKFFGKKVFTTVIPRNIRVSESPSHGVPVMLHDPKCSGARAYTEVTKEFLQRSESK